MEILSSKEYAASISQTIEEKELLEDYEANLVAIGKASANNIQEAFKEGKDAAVKHLMQTYEEFKQYYQNKGMEGLTFEAFDTLLDETVYYIMEDL